MKSLYKYIFILTLLIFSFHISQAYAEENRKTRILFILDASKSMSADWHGEEKFKIASRVLSEVLDSLKYTDNLEVALRVYGHQRNYPPQNCDDSKLEIAFAPNNFRRIKERLKFIKPRGTSPIALSLERSINDFSGCDNCRNIIILISDGIEECGGDICEISSSLQKKGIAIKPFIIGIGRDNSNIFDCAGTYFNAPDVESFQKTINVIITKVLSKTSLQVNLLDINGKPTESNINMAFTDIASGQVKYNFIHTLNEKGLPDTLVIDPLLEYNITLSTNPELIINNVKLSEGRHNIVYANCQRGKLLVELNGNNPADFNPAIIVKTPDNKTINVQSLSDESKYLSGNYNIEILSLPVTTINDVNIEADKTTKIQIENPGILNISKSIRIYGFIYHLTNNIQKRIFEINENSSRSESIYLQPGNYRLVYRPLYSNQSVFTQTIDFEIISSKTKKINL
ncbi:MAG: von willebrand factor type a [Marinilabiliales bacterium]|nr:MAG: von willebrand factor type a [Marinilabiliales bacterium]